MRRSAFSGKVQKCEEESANPSTVVWRGKEGRKRGELEDREPCRQEDRRIRESELTGDLSERSSTKGAIEGARGSVRVGLRAVEGWKGR